MPKTMRAIAFPSVFIPDLRAAMQDPSLSLPHFDECWHITSTTSIAKELRLAGHQALQISHLIYMMIYGVGRVLQPTDDPDDPKFFGTYPSLWEFKRAFSAPSERQQFEALDRLEQRIVTWEKRISSRELAASIANVANLRRHLYADTAAGPGVRRALMAGRIDFAESVKTLSEAGFTPSDLSAGDEIGEAARRAWAAMEQSDSDLRRTRERLWIDLKEYSERSTPLAKDIEASVRSALEHVFGSGQGGTVLQHGFYFYTSPQWALFRILEVTPHLEQIFVVHDDQENEVFQTWRRYFTDGMGFAPVEYVGSNRGFETDAATSLRHALAGKKVGGTQNQLALLKLRTPVSFVNVYRESHPDPDSAKQDSSGPDGQPMTNPEQWKVERDGLKVYAPSAPDIDRLLTRFISKSQFGLADFSTVPIGIFLVRIHECIEELKNRQRVVVLEPERLLDIVSSGFLPLPRKVNPLDVAAVMRKALPFFEGCREGLQWVDRARSLRDMVRTRLGTFGERDPSHSDVLRLGVAAENFYRLAPWADLSNEDVDLLFLAIQTTNDLVSELIQSEIIDLKDFAKHLREIIQQGLPNVPDEYRRDIEQRVDGLRMESIEAYALDLVELVRLLVAPPLRLRPSAIDSGNVRQFGALDRLAYRRRNADLHITNLSDRSFPRVANEIGWPFRPSDILAQTSESLQRSVELLELRTNAATLGDLYLLWVALNGVERDNAVVLSYIEEMGGEDLNPSPILVLLAKATISSKNEEFRKAIDESIGGLELTAPADHSDNTARILPLPDFPVHDPSALIAGISRIPSVIVAASLFCVRRLALQWLAGPTASFELTHLQSILYGNVAGAIQERHGISISEAQNLSDELWRHLTEGQRRSSYVQRRVKEKKVGGEKSAHYPWLFTIGVGTQSTTYAFKELESRALAITPTGIKPQGEQAKNVAEWRASKASRAAHEYVSERDEARSLAVQNTRAYLPLPQPEFLGVNARMCRNCPVAERCAAKLIDD